ncbi:TniB family NTP-binding protein [Caballeronia sp. LZ065]|uniref:TniB family NTP-binding protein n=1 Tax=Caballeronia sp. LZ065 TaxID=3038571 RepID=UPI00285E8F3C|nr:TniB family NTP-binding protein [Caballeronia sp. LZ065]
MSFPFQYHQAQGAQKARTWIDYPRATEALQVLERLHETPRRDRMPCLLIHGDSNIGKTKITAKFKRAHAAVVEGKAGWPAAFGIARARDNRRRRVTHSRCEGSSTTDLGADPHEGVRLKTRSRCRRIALQ